MLLNKHVKIISEFSFISIVLLLFKIIYARPQDIPINFLLISIVYLLLIVILLVYNTFNKNNIQYLLILLFYIYTFLNLFLFKELYIIIFILHIIGLLLTILVFQKINFIFILQSLICLVDNIYSISFTDKEILIYFTGVFVLVSYIGFHFSQIFKYFTDKIELLSKTDDFTELLNQRGFLEKLENEFHRSSRYNKTFALLMIDSDGLKKINDTYGHKYGSMTIKMIAEIIRVNTRRTDFAGRYGGDEFMVCLVESSKEDGLLFAERLRRTIEMKSIFTDKGKEVDITISIGVSCYPDSGKELYEILENADKALYNAKAKGKNSVSFL